jgi:site-specific DNA recombinase
VSTPRQGEHGVSLQEQRDAIVHYAQRNDLEVIQWFEERDTAAKRGRKIFNRMIKLLRHGKARGVLIHKIDRSARNAKDWAELGELIDNGIEIQFVNENLDLQSRGGRLSADIQAVVAADYIRNLREETRKGFYGRIKQGLYPLPAPLGYLDKGKGELKESDPAKAPLIKKAFELYGSGRYNLDSLGDELFRLGLRNRHGNRISRNGLSILLNNPFYIGIIRLKRTGETFSGSHQPLIAKSLFDRVQSVLEGKTKIRVQHHDFLFRRLLTCKNCGCSMYGEQQKGNNYYRCHTTACTTKCVREEVVEREVLHHFSFLRLDEQERSCATQMIDSYRKGWEQEKENLIQSLNLTLAQLNDRLGRLTDAYIDRVIDKEIFEKRKAALLMEQRGIDEKLARFRLKTQSVPDEVAKFLELAGSAYSLYKSGFPHDKQELVKTIVSNRHVEGKNLGFTLAFPFNELAKRHEFTHGSPYRDTSRTFGPVLERICNWFQADSNMSVGREHSPVQPW